MPRPGFELTSKSCTSLRDLWKDAQPIELRQLQQVKETDRWAWAQISNSVSEFFFNMWQVLSEWLRFSLRRLIRPQKLSRARNGSFNEIEIEMKSSDTKTLFSKSDEFCFPGNRLRIRIRAELKLGMEPFLLELTKVCSNYKLREVANHLDQN